MSKYDKAFEAWWEHSTEAKEGRGSKRQAAAAFAAGMYAQARIEERRRESEARPLRERLKIELDRTESWPNGCGGDLVARLLLDGEVISASEVL